jgi:hypothetical protein
MLHGYCVPRQEILSKDNETLLNEAIFYCPHKEIDPKGVADMWAKL